MTIFIGVYRFQQYYGYLADFIYQLTSSIWHRVDTVTFLVYIGDKYCHKECILRYITLCCVNVHINIWVKLSYWCAWITRWPKVLLSKHCLKKKYHHNHKVIILLYRQFPSDGVIDRYSSWNRRSFPLETPISYEQYRSLIES